MSFRLRYGTLGRGRQFIEMPDLYMGYVSNEDVNQLCFGLRIKNNKQPHKSTLTNSAISLAKKRKGVKK